MIHEQFDDSQVEVWTLNMDAGIDWLLPYRQGDYHQGDAHFPLHLPIMKDCDDAFYRYRLGREFRMLPPLYIVIDKQGIIRHRSYVQGSISLEAVAELVGELLNE